MRGELLDSNIVIDFLNGVDAAKSVLAEVTNPRISVVTWIEVLAGAITPEDETQARMLLEDFETLALSGAVAERTVEVRRHQRLKLPDAVIRATSLVHEMVLVTRNTKDFPADDPTIRIPYRL